MEFSHVPVLYREVIENLNVRPDGIYVDGTLGGGGHAEAVVKEADDKLYIGKENGRDQIVF